ncbi:MAG: hypothetical protein KBT34_10085 [Prevotella sp.]|nr:hypothetical protein [Candidatus Prevotella equi]
MLSLLVQGVSADTLDSLEMLMREQPQVQEKVYLHTDNSMYFVGDTLWYKAYVVRADDMKPTDMSKLLYVELLTPDGYLVERQHVVVSDKGYTCGQFVLEDSLYSGYYEIRAYTRWQLNFNVTMKSFTRDDSYKFYGKQAAKDFFRDFEGLYSRVLPIYEKPKEEGNYIDRYMAKRPKQRVLKEHTKLTAAFYPEGGHLIMNVPCRVAFELTDNNGQNVDVQGVLSNGNKIQTQRQGRGVFAYTPNATNQSVTFHWNDKDYTFHLPKALENGASIAYDAETKSAVVSTSGVDVAAYAILCRGRLVAFSRLDNNHGEKNRIKIQCDKEPLPTGINELIVYDNNAKPLASRLFFINNHDYGKSLTVVMSTDSAEINRKTTLQPYEKVTLSLSSPIADDGTKPATVSLAVRDAQTDDCGYDNGNIMTDMLLSSELKGFIANPAYYFESDDAKHRADLDMLMMVQGWRRYKRVDDLRYEPEKTLTYEGVVLEVPDIATVLELEDVMDSGVGDKAKTVADELLAQAEKLSGIKEGNTFMETYGAEATEETQMEEIEEPEVEYADYSGMRPGSGRVKKDVLVEAEIVKDKQSAGVITRTDKKGRFCINIPPFYDKAILFVRAYNVSDSISKCIGNKKGDKGWMDERQFPDYFVKRDMFYPVFSQPYSWYQVNSPDLMYVDEDEMIPENSSLAGNHTLQTVVVKARRRGKRSLDMTKPAIVRDAYTVYNELTDYGLSMGVVNFKSLPLSVATYFLGNMGRNKQMNIRAIADGASFYRNYTPMPSEYDKPVTPTAMFENLRLARIKNIRVFTDYELRTDSGDVVETHAPDVTLDFELVENDGKRYTYRDRRYVLDGITYPEQFYSPNYSTAIPEEPKDYRRTLYWNPNARVNEDGTFETTFYNNSRETRVTVTAAGMDSQGQMYFIPSGSNKQG